MADDAQRGVFPQIFRMPRFAPAWFAAFLCGLLLLFARDLPENVRSFFLPSLVVYAQGAALLGALHRMLGIHYQRTDIPDNEKPIPTGWKFAILFSHLIWFGALIGYNFFACVL
jgi:hypothetical protein